MPADPLPEIAQRIGPFVLGVDVLKHGQQRMLLILTAQANQTALGIMADSRQRLIELMGKTGGHLPSTLICRAVSSACSCLCNNTLFRSSCLPRRRTNSITQM